MLFFISWVEHTAYTHAQGMCRGQRTAFENWLSPSNMYFLGIGLACQAWRKRLYWLSHLNDPRVFILSGLPLRQDQGGWLSLLQADKGPAS